jgi:hypothetical protein
MLATHVVEHQARRNLFSFSAGFSIGAHRPSLNSLTRWEIIQTAFLFLRALLQRIFQRPLDQLRAIPQTAHIAARFWVALGLLFVSPT